MNRCMPPAAAFSIFIVWMLLSACVTRQTADLETRVGSWFGSRQSDVESYWGRADKTLEMGGGMRLLQYKAAKSRVDYPCVVIFSVNPNGLVLGSKWNGDRHSCENFVIEVPESDKTLLLKKKLVQLEVIGKARGH